MATTLPKFKDCQQQMKKPTSKINTSGIKAVRISKREKQTKQSKTRGRLLLVSFFPPTHLAGNKYRKSSSIDTTVYCFEETFEKYPPGQINSGSLVVSLGRVIESRDGVFLEVVSPTGKIGFVNVVFLYNLNQAVLESLGE